MVRQRKWWWVALSGLALSCIRPQAKSPVTGDESWIALESEHFRVSSDVGEADAQRVIGSFEETYGLLGEVVFGAAAVPRFHTDAVIFRDHHDLTDFIGEGFGGVYTPSLPNDPEPRPTVLASGTLSPFTRLIFAHELAHRFNHVALGPTPTWLNEGLADYYSTIRGDHGKPIVGEIDPRYMCTPDGLGDMVCYEYDKLPGNRLPRASEVVALDRQGFYGRDKLEDGHDTWAQKRQRAANYGVAWLLVHLLMNGKQDYAQEFRRVLATPPSLHKGLALAQAVGHASPEQLDRDFQSYLKQGMPWRQHHASSPEIPSGLERRSLSASEILVLWARLDDFTGKSAKRALERLNQSQKLAERDQGVADASTSFWLGRYDQLRDDAARAEQQYRRALQAKPGNPEFLYGLLTLYWSTSGGKSWVDAARSEPVVATIAELAKSAHTADQLNAVAAHQLFSNDVPAALATSEQACAVGADCWPCFHNRAAALFAGNQRDEALAAEREALSRMPEGASAKLGELVSRSVGYYERAARGRDNPPGEWSPGLIAP